MQPLKSKIVNLTVIVAALGYFVDIFDLQLFNIVSKASIKSPHGLAVGDSSEIARLDVTLFNWQMTGMLIGGLLWGILGDLKGRKSILFGSIFLYSIANIANAFVTTEWQYSTVRFFAGLGLAGELGAAITLISEIMSKEKRGYGTMLIVALGALGAVAARFVSKMDFGFTQLEAWQTSYIIGGLLGILLLGLRFTTYESGMFEKVKHENVQKGQFLLLFKQGETIKKYISCILIGLPVWYILGILIKFSDNFSKTNGITGNETIDRSTCIMLAYIGLSTGDLISGWLSQVLRSRKKVVTGYILTSMVLSVVFLYNQNISATFFYALCFLLGCATGYWALFVTIASEQFGTNIRATVTTTVPNFVRGAVVPVTILFQFLIPGVGDTNSALIVGVITIGLAFLGILQLSETFGKDLNYTEDFNNNAIPKDTEP